MAATISITDANPNNPDNNLFNITFNTTNLISTTLTSDPTVATTWLSAAATSATTLLIGLDIEWRPNRSRNSDNPVATLQLCTTTTTTTQFDPVITNSATCLIFQLLHCPAPLPKPLTDFLSTGPHTFVGVGIEADVERLLCDHDLRVGKIVDLADLAAEKAVVPRKGCGLKELAKAVLGVEVVKPKSVTMSRWDSEWLSLPQIQYASVDAFLSYEIGKKLMID